MNQHDVRFEIIQYGFQPGQNAAGNFSQTLPRLHDVEIIIGCNFKQSKYLIKHFTVLSVTQTLDSNAASCDKACTSGAIFMASGRVPKIVNTFTMCFSYFYDASGQRQPRLNQRQNPT